MGTNQHYVPQFLLRNWSSDHKSIKLFTLKDREFKQFGSIKSQAQEPNYYGDDQHTENWLSRIEDQASPIIRILQEGNVDIDFDQFSILCFFLAVQYLRTPLFDMKKNMFYRAMENSMDPLLLKHFQKHDSRKEESPEMNFMFFRSVSLSFVDLRLILLKANDINPFIIGKDPLLVINPLFSEMHITNGKHGLGNKGIVLCMPISPLYSICMYDRDAYYSSANNRIATLRDADIDLLNKYQILKTDDCFYTSCCSDRLKNLAFGIKKEPKNPFATYHYGSFQNEFIHFTENDYEFPESPSFLSIKAKALTSLERDQGLSRPQSKLLLDQAHKRWGLPESPTVYGTPVSKKEYKKLKQEYNRRFPPLKKKD